MIVIIAGSRDYHDYNTLRKECNFYLQRVDVQAICSGGCIGADLMGEMYAYEKNIPIVSFLPDWSLGKKAGPIRNEEMAKFADALIVFWDGKSAGTYDMIKKAMDWGLDTRIIKPKHHNLCYH